MWVKAQLEQLKLHFYLKFIKLYSLAVFWFNPSAWLTYFHSHNCCPQERRTERFSTLVMHFDLSLKVWAGDLICVCEAVLKQLVSLRWGQDLCGCPSFVFCCQGCEPYVAGQQLNLLQLDLPPSCRSGKASRRCWQRGLSVCLNVCVEWWRRHQQLRRCRFG